MKKKIENMIQIVCVAAIIAAFGWPATARAGTLPADVLVDGGFENNPLGVGYGVWRAENAAITGTDNGVGPRTGSKMLRMNYDPPGSATQAWQATDISEYADIVDAENATVIMTGFFNVPADVSAARASLSVSFFSDWNRNNPTGPTVSNGLDLDALPGTWEEILVSGDVPVGTRYIQSALAYRNSSIPSAQGYVDDVETILTPEPCSMSVLALGGLAVLRRRSCLLRRRRS